ncbi:TrkH family potassium uptake protein [Phycisphaerales bacterium AB-hyl4]|uniref:TrkH family potassium uptake protein n=1 Tax=Natronomicrosphaera hydrolytica TaxID=3242702 RepID=A0ABV4U7E1_9BACT
MPYGRLPEPPKVRLRPMVHRVGLTAAAAACIVFEHGFYEPRIPLWLIHGIQGLMLALFAGDMFWRARRRREPVPGASATWFDASLLVGAAVGGVGALVGIDIAWRLVEVAAGVLFFMELWRLNVALARVLRRPGLLLPMSFFVLILIGTVLLKAPVAVPAGERLSWPDAIFTMTSAVCVTGLTVRDTATTFTPYGHTVIGIFIQLGGLGIIIFGSVLALMFGRTLSLREDVSLSQMLHDQPLQDITRFVRFIVVAALTVELLAALIMMPMWEPPPGETYTLQQRFGMGMFHAVSAFCNAGFDLTGDSMVPYRFAPLAHLVIIPLVIFGSIGFPVLDNLWRVGKAKVVLWLRRPRVVWRPLTPFERPVALSDRPRLNLHTKIVLATSGIVYVVGFVVLMAAKLIPYLHPDLTHGVPHGPDSSQPLTLAIVWQSFLDASFLSFSSRTAGFNSMPMEELSMAGRFTTMVLMLIGGSPGGTAGGAKSTVVALLVLSVFATLRGRRETEAFGRTISDSMVRRAATLGICYIALASVVTVLLSISEGDRHTFEAILFDSISATAVTGLSLGVTDDITEFGKGVVIVTMFLGRVGPLTLLGALMLTGRKRRPYGYAHEDVVLG